MRQVYEVEAKVTLQLDANARNRLVRDSSWLPSKPFSTHAIRV